MPGGGVGLAWLKEADWVGAWVGTSHLGLRDAMGMSVCSWVLCLCFSMTGCLELYVQMYVSTFMSPCICMKMFACPRLLVSTFVHVHVLPLPHLRGPMLQFPVFYPCLSTCLSLVEFLNVSGACLWVCQCCCVFLWGVSVCPCMFFCVALWPPPSP